MPPLRILTCDDEPLALQRLADLIAYCRDAVLIGAVQDSREVVPTVHGARPDVLLLDIEMPKLGGFDLLDRLGQEDFGDGDYFPQIVIVTAHSHFAAMAFETGTLDFLTKPVRLARLELALNRARDALARQSARQRVAELAAEVEQLRRRTPSAPGEQRQLWVRARDEVIRVDHDQIAMVRAEGEYVRIHVGGASYLHREPLTTLAARLDPDTFLRVHRSIIVRLAEIRSVRRTLHGALRLTLRSGEELPVGRMFRPGVADLLAAGRAAEG